MKKHISIFMLHVRSTIYKILPIFAIMAALEFYLFSRLLKNALESENYNAYTPINLSYLFEESHIHFVFLGAFLLVSLVLTLNGFEFKNKISYTIRRLRITEKEYCLIQGLTYSLYYLLFLTFQIVIVYLLSQYYFRLVPSSNYSNQTLFLIFYSNHFLHSLLPLEETTRVARNVLMIPALGFSSAYQSYSQRRGSRQFMFLILAFLVVLNFKASLGSFISDIIIILASIIVLFVIGTNLLKRGNGYAN